MNQSWPPAAARDAALARVAWMTATLVAVVAGTTLGLGVVIAASVPDPKAKAPTDFSTTAPEPDQDGTPDPEAPDEGAGATVTLEPPDDRPESSSGDEDTTSGGS